MLSSCQRLTCSVTTRLQVYTSAATSHWSNSYQLPQHTSNHLLHSMASAASPVLTPKSEIALYDENRVREGLWEARYLKRWGEFANINWENWVYSLAEESALKEYSEAVVSNETEKVNRYRENFIRIAQIEGQREGVDKNIALAVGHQILYLYNGFILTEKFLKEECAQIPNLDTGDKSMLFWSGFNDTSPVQDEIMKRFGDAGVTYDSTEKSKALQPSKGLLNNIINFAIKFVKNPIVTAVWDSVLKQLFTWYITPGTDNWCFCQVGDIAPKDSICFTSYSSKDFLRLKSYRAQYIGDGGEVTLNAGNKPEVPFQVTVWCKLDKPGYLKKWKVLKTLNYVYYRDVIRVAKGKQGDLVVVHCKSRLHGGHGAGDVKLYKVS